MDSLVQSYNKLIAEKDKGGQKVLAMVLIEPADFTILMDTLLNFRKYISADFKIFSVIFVKPSFLNNPENFRFIPQLQNTTFLKMDSNDSIWGKTMIFEYHMRAISYMLDLNYWWDYISFNSTNQLMFRPLTKDNLSEFCNDYDEKIKTGDLKFYTDDEYKVVYGRYMEDRGNKWWWPVFRMDTYSHDWFLKNRIEPICKIHEGLLFTRATMLYLYRVFKDSQIEQKKTINHYVLEELFLASIFHTRFGTELKSPTYMNWEDTHGPVEEFLTYLSSLPEKYIYYKRIAREYEDPYRVLLRNK